MTTKTIQDSICTSLASEQLHLPPAWAAAVTSPMGALSIEGAAGSRRALARPVSQSALARASG